jgi:tRNA pseudouridine(55) synthase
MIKIRKKLGQTPLELLDELRKEQPEIRDEKLSYAGRLDPMATGETFVLVGEKENKDRKKYLNFNKTYVAHVLFGFETDSGDLLGLVEKENATNYINKKALKKALKQISKIDEIEYPVFSSKTVKGKPLFQWYREGNIDQINIPKRKVKIYKAKLLDTYEMSSTDLLNYIEFAIGEVSGDFRQKEILKKWEIAIDKKTYQVAKIKFKVSSGTYIRVLAKEIGDILKTNSCLLALDRIKIHKNFIKN